MTGLGFVGVGGLGEALVRDLSRIPSLRLAAVQDARGELAAAVAARHGAPWHGDDYHALLAAPGVDAVVVCTPNALHVPQARQAIEAGKHVLVQKPLALRCGDATRLVDLAADRERLLFVDYSYRYLATTRALHDALPRLGRVRRASAAFHNVYGPGSRWFFDPALAGGGALTDLGVHLLDLALWLLSPGQLDIEEVSLSRVQGHAVEDAAELRLRLDDVPFDLSVGWNADRPLTEIAFAVESDGGRASWRNVDGSFFRFRTATGAGTVLERETTLREDTLRAFAEALAAGQTPPVDLRVYDLLDRAYGRA